MVHDMSPNRNYGVLVYQLNVTLALMSKTEVSLMKAELKQDSLWTMSLYSLKVDKC